MSSVKRFLLVLIVLVWTVCLYAATFVSDTFTDTTNTALTAHVPDTGGTWTNSAVCFSSLNVTDHNDISLASALAGCTIHNDQTPNSAEYNVQVDIVFHSGSIAAHSVGIAGRISASLETYYGASYDGFAGEWALFRAEAGSFTGMGTFTQALSSGNTYQLRLEIKNATKKVFVNGVERISSADNSITDTNFAGLNWYREDNIDGVHLDNFSAFDIVVAGGGQKRLLLMGVGDKQ